MLTLEIDSALFLPLAASFLCLLWVSLCGAVLLRLWCGIHDWTFLPPLGFATGCSLFVVLANLAGKLGSVPLAFASAFFVLSALGIYATVRLWPQSWRPPSRRSLLGLIGWTLLALVVAYICLVIRSHSYFYDFPTHLAFAATIARDNLPVRNPYAPVSPAGYHYGAALLVAALSRGLGLPAVTGYVLVAAFQGAALLLVVFALGREAGKHALWGLASLVATLAMGSLVVWWPFAHTPPELSALLQGNLSQELLLNFPSLRGYIELVYPIVSFSTDLRWLLVYPHRVAGLLTVLSLTVVAVGPGTRRWDYASVALCVTVAAAVSLYDETMLPLALMALAWPLLLSRRDPRRLLLWVSGLLAATGIIAFQGGIVTDAILDSSGLRPPFSLRPAADAVRSMALARTLPEGWLWILPPLPLAASAAVFTWKRWWTGLMLCGFGFAGYVGYHILNFAGVAGPGEFTRVVNLSFLMLALVLPYTVACLLRDRPWWSTAIAMLLLLPVTIPTIVQPVVSLVSDSRIGVYLPHPENADTGYSPQITDPAVTRELSYYRAVYRDIVQILPRESVVLTEYPVSFVIETGLTAAYAPISGNVFYPSHRYVADPAFYDAYWRLDPAAWRTLGATAVLYHQKTFESLPPTARRLVETSGWFVRQYDKNQFLLLTPTEAFFRYGTTPPNTFSSLAEVIAPSDTLFLSLDLPYGVGQALVHLLKNHAVTGLGPDPGPNNWVAVTRPPELTPAQATWHVRSHEAVRGAGQYPEAARWHWRAPSESVGVYPNSTIPAFPLKYLAADQSFEIYASHNSLALKDSDAVTSASRFQTLTLVLAGHQGSVIQFCSPAGCANLDLAGGTWAIGLPLAPEQSLFTISVVHGEAFVAGTFGYSEPLSAERTPGVVIKSRQIANTIEIDAGYFNLQGWTLGNGVAWQLVREFAEYERESLARPSQLIIHGERGDVRFTLDASGIHTEDNFTSPPIQLELDEALPDGDYRIYLNFKVEDFRTVIRVPTARFSVQDSAVVSFTSLSQIARLSFGTGHLEPIVLEK